MERLVWYVSFGSNTDPERFACYLQGGRPDGATREYGGARDPSPPRAAEAVRIPHRLHFGGRSSVWGGGVAFVHPAPDPAAATPAVAWLVTAGQLSDVIAQENAGSAPGPALGALPTVGERMVLDTGWYDALVGVQTPPSCRDGHPAVVLTASVLPRARPPSPAYVEMLRRGRRRWFPEEEDGLPGPGRASFG